MVEEGADISRVRGAFLCLAAKEQEKGADPAQPMLETLCRIFKTVGQGDTVSNGGPVEQERVAGGGVRR